MRYDMASKKTKKNSKKNSTTKKVSTIKKEHTKERHAFSFEDMEHAFGYVDDNLVFLNVDEYAYSAGAKIVVRPFKTSDEKKNKYLE